MTAIKDRDIPSFLAYTKKRMQDIALNKNFPVEAYKFSDPKRQSLPTQWMKFQYLCKGVDPSAKIQHISGRQVQVADLIQFAHESPGNFSRWKRCGISQNISLRARRANGFVSTLERGILHVDLLYGSDKRLTPEQPSPQEILDSLQSLNL
jgi:hypothetical protein